MISKDSWLKFARNFLLKPQCFVDASVLARFREDFIAWWRASSSSSDLEGDDQRVSGVAVLRCMRVCNFHVEG